jgi:hypothetical protein
MPLTNCVKVTSSRALSIALLFLQDKKAKTAKSTVNTTATDVKTTSILLVRLRSCSTTVSILGVASVLNGTDWVSTGMNMTTSLGDTDFSMRFW